MKKHFKLLTILLSVILCFSAVTYTVWAEDADGDGYDDITGEFIGGEEQIYTDPVYTDPPAEPTDVPSYVDPTDEPSYVDPTDEPSYYEPSDEPSYEEPQSSYEEYSYIADTPSYVGGGQTYVPPQSTAPSVSLIDSDHKIDVNELSSNDWKDIAAKLKNADASVSDGDDFSFIQKNDSAGDNGEWVLVLGIVLVLLSLAGIVYFIASGVALRKKLAFAGGSSPKNSAGSQNRYRSNDDYGDGYRVSKKEEKKKADRNRRYDTAEVNIPKNNNKNRYR